VLEAVEKAEIRILADNVTDGLSSNPPFIESEMAFPNAIAPIAVGKQFTL